MSGVEQLVAFVRRCLDRDEQVALAAGDLAQTSDWWASAEGNVCDANIEDRYSYVAKGPDGRSLDDIGEHIARWDPARVLAEVEAKRRVLDRYADMHWHAPAIPGATSSILQVEDTGACRTCVTVQILAQPYAGQDGWREEWAL